MVTRAELKTARLTLRPVGFEDEEAVLNAISDLAVSSWLSVVPYPYTASDFHQFRTEIARPGETYAVLDGQGFAGIIGAGRVLGYWFDPRCHGQGYATEAARAVLAEQLAHNPTDVDSGYFEGNARSANVLCKLGFVETGREPKHCRALGIDRPHVDMLLTREAFTRALPIEARSKRLTYRSIQATDFDVLHAIGSDWAVVRQLWSWPWPPEPDFTVTRATPYLGEGFAWGVFLQGAMIGTVAVTGEVLGFSLLPAYWLQGYGEEAVRTALTTAFLRPDLGRITASVWADNDASIGLLRKLGFGQTGRTVEMSKARKVDTPLIHLALDRTAWSFDPTA